MRVIAGTAKGMKLKAPKGFAVRPTADRVKEALFNILGARVIGACFIDLYAGSGAIGIEALSRGADSCIFVDNQESSHRLIKENLAKTGLIDKARVIMSAAEKSAVMLSSEGITADVFYLDPPYNYPGLPAVVSSIFEYKLLSGSGLLVAEHAYKNRQWAADFAILKQKKYGDTCLSIIAPPPPA